MNQAETLLLCGFVTFTFTAIGLYHLLVFKVNQQLPPERRIPHSLSLVGWSRLATEYRRFHPRSFLYQFTVTCAVTGLFIAMAFTALRVWEYATGR